MKINRMIYSMILGFSLFTRLPFGFANEGTLMTAELKPTQQGSTVAGTATFEATENGLVIHVEVTGASPGAHGIHIHENGGCGNQGNDAGGHFNPDHAEHGDLVKDGFSKAHAGDLGNIEIAADGTGKLDVTLPGLTVEEGKYAVKGRALVLHEKEDDFGQPTGNAGGRIACAVL